MPTYVYQCKTCGHHFERMQRFSDAPITECPQCEGEVRRVIQAAGVIFKGSGWYITDSRPGTGAANSTSKTETASDTAATTSESTSTEKADAKPAAKAEAKSES